MNSMRLDKFLSECQLGTRTEVKKYIKNGRVRIDGQLAKDPACKIDADKNSISFDMTELKYEKYRYYMFNKPAGCVSATKDRLSETVLSYFSDENTEDLFPVGRLDKDTEGLLLITNDGALAHNLLSPKKHVDKIYYAKVTGKLSEEAVNCFEEGLDIGDDRKTLPGKIELITDNENEIVYKVTIHEGRYHQVKRMFEALGEQVLFLKRISMASLVLDEKLMPGQYRRLTEEELEQLK